MLLQKNTIAVLLLLFVFLKMSPIFAETIEFPEEELATESVLPVFDNAKGVLNRTVKTANRIEFGGGAGLSLNEPFYNPVNFHLQGSYHFTELHGVNLFAMFLMEGLSSYGDQLKTTAATQFDASKAPAPQNIFIASYQVNAFYGKISLTKKSVMNLTTLGTLGAGLLGLDSGTQLPAINFGFGQKFYFSKNFALRFDFRVIAYQGPDPTSQPLLPGSPAPSEGSFDDELFFNTYLSAGAVFLL